MTIDINAELGQQAAQKIGTDLETVDLTKPDQVRQLTRSVLITGEPSLRIRRLPPAFVSCVRG